jgi:ATP-dependent DNA helicase PIF1
MLNYSELDFNEEFAAAFEALENTGRHIFITGKAGTGKSTLLQYFRQKTAKNLAVLAPTGVAAVNIKGQTIHSFFNFKPDVTPESVGDIPVRKRKRKMYQELGVVVIDEVSMVRADLMDCIDIFLRLYGPFFDRPFGGIQMIFFGDLFQLPPVVGQGEQDIFKTHYATPYFFSAKVFASLDFNIMPLKKIYRQKDENFIRLLNAVREDSVESHHWEELNRRLKPGHQFSAEEFYIVLTTTNALAEKVNNQRLQSLPGVPKIYNGAVSGEFERKSLPAPEALELKAGAQVMMLSNDPDKRWVNGSLGKITDIIAVSGGDDVVMVELESGSEVDVTRHTWEIYQYYFDEVGKSLASKVIGYFTQYPLKPAWAVTIHKSQGQTFERVIIDVGWGTFSHGQMYVALSRCTTLEGIVLKQPLARRHILMDERVLQFMKKFVFLLFLPIFSLHASAQTPILDRNQSISRELGKIEDKQVNPRSWEERNSSQPYIGLLAETDMTMHDDWSFDEDYHARIKIQKETAKSLGQWPIYYNKSREQITVIEAFIETPEGRKLQATDIKDLPAFDQSPAYSDLRLKVITFPQINIGTILDVRVKTRVLKEEIPNQFWDEVTYPSIPTKYARNTYTFPEGKPMHFFAYNNDKKPLVEKNNGAVKYSFIFEETSFTETGDFAPPSDEVTGVLSLSSMGDWKQAADWWRGEINKDTVESREMADKALELVKDKTDPKDRVRAVMEFIQDNFRYVSMSPGEHTVGPHATAETFKNRYGDGKDLALLARQMLKIGAIDANICLFSGEFNGDPRHRLPGLSAFDNVMLEVDIGSRKFFVDPQTKGFDAGELPSTYDGGHVLVITPDSYHFGDIPVADESFHSVVSTGDITLADDGSANFQVQVKMPVEESVDFKNSWDPASDSSKQKFFDKLQATFAQGGKITDHEVKGLESRYGPLEFDFKYAASNVYEVANDMVLLREQQQDNVPDFSVDKRPYPVFIPTNSLIINRNTYHIPDTMKINYVPPDYDLASDFMRVAVRYIKGDGTITVESAYHLKRASVPVQGFEDIKKFRDALNKKGELYIVLKKKAGMAPETEGWLKSR